MPRKNVAPLAGRPLLAYTCEAARNSRLLDRVVVSTDDEEIARVARHEGVEVPFMRPAALAGDNTPMIDVVRHAVTELRSQGYEADAVVVLQPTSPLRRGSHIDDAVDLLNTSGADTVVTVVKVPHEFVPSSLMRVEAGRLVPIDAFSALRRQDKPVLLARNGPAVLAVRTAVLEKNSFYSGDVRGIEMTFADSVDIDSAEDLLFAEFLIRRGSC